MITPQNLPAALGRFPDLVSPAQIPGILSKIPPKSALLHPAWSASDIKDGAHDLRRAAGDCGVRLPHGHALRIASAAYGFSSWNAALGALGRREEIAIPDTINPLICRFERLSSCSPGCLHGNFPGLVDRLLHPGAAKARLPDPLTTLDGICLGLEDERRTLLVLSHDQSGLGRLKDLYPLEHVVFSDQPFCETLWQALRLGIDHIILDRPNAQNEISFETFEMICRAQAAGHNMIIASDAPGALPLINSFFEAPDLAYQKFLAA